MHATVEASNIRRVSARVLLGLGVGIVAAGCASGGAAPATDGGGAGTAAGATPNIAWPVKTRDHVDLWLHGFAMLTEDTTKVPLFRRNYRSEMQVLKNQRNILTQLDANRSQLVARLTANRSLANAQFLALYFGSWADMKTAAEHFIQTQGDPSRARDQAIQGVIAFLAQNFPTAADREWFRLFVTSLEDERVDFYESYWLQQNQSRGNMVSTLDNQWQQTYYPKFRRFLMGTQQASGDMIVSLPLGGEGRTISSSPTSVSSRSGIVAVTYPQSDPLEAIYVFAHEIVGTIMSGVITDNTTPAQRREGVADRYAADGLVIGGALLLQRIAPELVDGYARYYLRTAGRPVPGGDVQAALAAAFPLPENFRAGFLRQLDIVLGGI